MCYNSSLFGFSNCLSYLCGLYVCCQALPVSTGGCLSILSPTGLAHCLKCSCVSRVSRYTFFNCASVFWFDHTQTSKLWSVSLLIKWQPVITPWGGYLHMISAVALDIFNSRIIIPERKKPTLSDFHFGLFIFCISTIILKQRLISPLRLRVGVLLLYSFWKDLWSGGLVSFAFELVLEMEGGKIKDGKKL